MNSVEPGFFLFLFNYDSVVVNYIFLLSLALQSLNIHQLLKEIAQETSQ